MVTTAPLQGLAEEHLQIRIPPRTLTKEDNTGVVYPAAQGRGYANEPPELASEVLEREKGFEPSTLALARRCSTTELFPLGKGWRRSAGFYSPSLRLSSNGNGVLQRIVPLQGISSATKW